jgi:hypothetical protein
MINKTLVLVGALQLYDNSSLQAGDTEQRKSNGALALKGG